MGGLDVLALIIRRDHEMACEPFLRTEYSIQTLVSFPCHGTATASIMERLGLEQADKTLMLTFVEHSKGRHMLSGCVRRLGLEVAGYGIAFLAPLSSIGGQRAFEEMTYNQYVNLQEVKTMDRKEFPYEMLIAICENGNTDLVMDAARSAGARGGTVVHAKGTIGDRTRRFLGVSIASEKELILILTSGGEKDALMRAIMEKAGIDSPAHTILFSMPVDSVAGLRSIMAQEEKESL